MIAPDLIEKLEIATRQEIVAEIEKGTGWVAHAVSIVNEVKPSDLFCYLGARFGQPNGFQNALRTDSSDNLIHWEWALKYQDNFIYFQGHNFRTEVHLPKSVNWDDSCKEELVRQIQNDFRNHCNEMSHIRKGLEFWVEFVNPYQRLRRAVESLRRQLDALELDVENRTVKDDELPNILSQSGSHVEQDSAISNWSELAGRYSKAFPLCFGIRSMLPVLAESYVNFLLHVLLRPEIRDDTRLRENAIRQPIDVRVKSLSLTCVGFSSSIDYTNDVCKSYHSLVNQRNDLLHGNVVVDKLKFNDIFFWGKVPVYQEYRSMWERTCGVEAQMVGLDKIAAEQQVVDDFIEYLTSCIDPRIRPEIVALANSHELGYSKKTQRLGILFVDRLVDFGYAPNAGQLRLRIVWS